MNILILNWRDTKHPLAGGAEEVLLEYAKYWIEKGNSVTWFASGFDGAKQSETVQGINIIRGGSHFTVAISAFSSFLKGTFKETDVIVDCFHFIPYFSKLYVWNKPIVGLIHEYAGKLWFENTFFPVALVGFLLEPLFLFLYRNNQIITGAISAKEELSEKGLDRNKITVVHHGFTKININSVKKEKTPIISFLGRLSKDKGIEDALAAFAKFSKTIPNVKMWIIGKAESEEYFEELKKIVNIFNIEKSVKFFGFVTQREKFELLAKAWVLVHPSSGEGWGLNVIEANSVGTPAVGYDVSGLRDSIQDGKTGLLVDKDPDSLYVGLMKIVKDKERLRQYSDNAKKWATQFTWDKAGEQSFVVIKAYEKR